MAIYFFLNTDGLIKIGYSKDTEKRHEQLAGKHGALRLLGIRQGTLLQEQELHKQFAEYRVSKKAEWFYPAQPIMAYIANYTHMNIESMAQDKPLRQVHLQECIERYNQKTGDNLTLDALVQELHIKKSELNRWANMQYSKSDNYMLAMISVRLDCENGELVSYPTDTPQKKQRNVRS